MAPAGEVHTVNLVELAAPGIHKVGSHQLGGLLIERGKLFALLDTASSHGQAAGIQFHPLPNGRRADNEDVRRVIPPAIHALGLADQPLHTNSDTGCVDAQPLLDIVGAQHDDQKVNHLMALEKGIGAAQCIHALVERVGKNGGPARQALLCHQIVFPQCLLEKARPTLVLIKTDAAVRTVGRVGTVAVGVGVAQTKNVFFQNPSSFNEQYELLSFIRLSFFFYLSRREVPVFKEEVEFKMPKNRNNFCIIQ